MQYDGAPLISRPQQPVSAYGPRPSFDELPSHHDETAAARRPLWQRKALRVGLVVAALAVSGLVIMALVREQTGTRGLIVGLGLAVLPVPLLVMAFRWVDRVEPGPWRNLAFAFAWGACAATLVAMLANTFAARWIASGLPTASDQEADLWGAALVAPVVEESAKAGAIVLLFLLRRRHFTGLVDGVVIAGITATGFAFTENVLYLGTAYDEDRALGNSGLLSTTSLTFFARVIFSPFAHPLFTAPTGIGFGLAALAASSRRTRRILLPAAGLLLAMALHAVWNGAAILSGYAFLAVYALFMVPLFGMLVWLTVWSRGRELRTIRDTLPAYAAAGWLTPAEPVALSSLRTRKLARTFAATTHGDEGARAVREYATAATELALLRARAARGGPEPDFTERERDLLDQMWHRKALAQPTLTRAAFTTNPPRRSPLTWPSPRGLPPQKAAPQQGWSSPRTEPTPRGRGPTSTDSPPSDATPHTAPPPTTRSSA